MTIRVRKKFRDLLDAPSFVARRLLRWSDSGVVENAVLRDVLEEDPTLSTTTLVWDDVQGPALQAAGISALTQEVYRDTPAVMPFFQHNQNDSLTFYFQLPHSWKRNTEVRVHIHVIPMVDPSVSPENIRLQYRYAWAHHGAELPANVSWTTGIVDHAVTTGDAFKEDIIPLFSTTPSGSKESSFLIANITRLGLDAGDTYSTNKAGGTIFANLAVLNADAHYQREKRGTLTDIPV